MVSQHRVWMDLNRREQEEDSSEAVSSGALHTARPLQEEERRGGLRLLCGLVS